MSKSIVIYLQVHQPFRIKHYTVFDTSNDHEYFNDDNYSNLTNNQLVLDKVCQKSYLPTNHLLLKLLEQHDSFKLSLSLSGVVIEQLERWQPETLESFKRLAETGKVEFLAETYYHSLAFFYSRDDFEEQVRKHQAVIERVFNQTPKVFRHTELAYNNDLAYWADQAGYKGILAEGWDPILGWRSPNFVYQPTYTENIKLLLKNYHLSDDIAFRFGDKDWVEWPLTADKFTHWLDNSGDATNFNLFMDYETFGEHQWEDKGIFEFLETLPGEWLKNDDHSFMTVSELIDHQEPVDRIDVPHTITWADTERDLSAWLGNRLQQEAINALYELESKVKQTGDSKLLDDWRKLQTSDHFYYMCTKWFNDGDIHAYFSPYDNPYDAFINYMNVYHDLRARLMDKGVAI